MIGLAFALTSVTCFALGWYGHDWWGKPQRQKVLSVMKKPRFTTQGKVYLACFAIFMGSVWFLDYRGTDKVSDSEQRQNDLNTVRVACLSRAFEDFLNGNQEIRDANTRWRAALVGSKKAESMLNQLRYIDHRPADDPAITQAARQYVVQTQNFIEASEDYNKALVKYKLPDFEKRCGKLKPRVADVIYRDLQEPEWRAQLTSSLE